MSIPADEEAARRAGAILSIDLGAIAANWRGLRDAGRATGRPIDCAAVLKADAYGTGAALVGPRLAAEGCRRRGDRAGWQEIRRCLEGGAWPREGAALLQRLDAEGMVARWLRQDPARPQGWAVHRPVALLLRRHFGLQVNLGRLADEYDVTERTAQRWALEVRRWARRVDEFAMARIEVQLEEAGIVARAG